MADDYVPRADAKFDGWQQNFVDYATANAVALGLDPAVDLPPVATAQAAWKAGFPAHLAAQAAAESARQAKDDARAGFEKVIRPLVRRLQAGSKVDDAARAALGITVPDLVPTPSAVPVSRPVVKVDTAQRLRHTIAFADEATPTRTAKPAGVMGAEIWVKVGDPPPVGPAELTFLALDTRTPYVARYAGSDANKTAHYMLRWVNTRGEKGPWSETASATIGA